jgi:hypothetical protein
MTQGRRLAYERVCWRSRMSCDVGMGYGLGVQGRVSERFAGAGEQAGRLLYAFFRVNWVGEKTCWGVA